MKIMLSGVKPSGRPHIGNYFGAMRQFVELQKNHRAFIMIADLHAMTTLQDGEKLRQATLDLALDYLAIGLDPAKVTIFKQSDVPAHAELAWVLNCITTMPYLMRAHAFKDAEAKNKEINVGVFTYPLLMSADILLYNADVVPVGHDQKQHIEYTRDIAEKFNHIYGNTFKLPEPLILGDVATVPGIDGQKMSKSYGNTIPLFSTDEEIQKLVMSIVTDSSGDVPKNVYEIHKLFRTTEELDALYTEKKGKYKDLKEALAKDIKAFIGPLREKREALAKDPAAVKAILEKGAAEANATANTVLASVKKAAGLSW
jgi:tryptophanyl-tRNA synthetase